MASDLPSWLQAPPPSEPFQALLAGVRAGTGIASNVLQGQRQAEQARQFDVETQFKQRAEEYQLQLASLAVQKAKTARDYQYQTDQAATQIGQLLLTTRPDAPEYMNQLGAIGAQYPAVMSDPVWKHAMDLPEQSARIKLQTAQAYHAMSPISTAEDKNIESGVQRADKVKFLNTGQHLTQIEAADLAQKLGAPKNFHMSIGPDGNMVIDYGPEGATTATQSALQLKMVKAREFVSMIDDTQRGMTADAVGVRGKLAEFTNRFLGQVNPDWVNLPVAEQRVLMAQTTEKQIEQYDRSGRMSQLDRERIKEIGPSQGWFETPERASQALTTMRAISQKNAIIDAKSAKMPVDDWMIKGLSPNDLTDLAKRGTLTLDEAKNIFLKLYPNAKP